MKKNWIMIIFAVLGIIFLLSNCSTPLNNSDQNQYLQNKSLTTPTGLIKASSTTNRIDGSYIVVLKNTSRSSNQIKAQAENMVSSTGSSPDHIFSTVLQGFSIKTTKAEIDKLLKNDKVAYIEEDQVVSINEIQQNATWGIDRIDQQDLPLSKTYNYAFTGKDVDTYIIDTGIRFSHSEFGGRAITGIDIINAGGTATDDHGHGTHVAGTVGGKTYGVAKNVRLISVKVLGSTGNGTTSGVIAGIEWVTNHHSTRKAVANMSLGGGISYTLDAAVRNSIADGIVYCLAAGNEGDDASNHSPGRVSEGITVGAVDSSDNFGTWYSCFGSVVDILAPGTGVLSATNTSDYASKISTGTSMATPHVAGVSALLLEQYPTYSPAQIQTMIKSFGEKNTITNVPTGTVNLLLQSSVYYSTFIHNPKDNPNLLHEDVIMNYKTWDGSNWSVRLVGSTFIHAPNGDFSKSHNDIIINYLSWNGSKWTAKYNGSTFIHAPNGNFSQAHNDTIINYVT
ncbi:MAG: hypothetical protein A2355_15330, partial [Spirochaetes bacterium RIFOXYB1_FULL_32_8]